MYRFIKRNIEYIVLIFLYLWICFCAIFNMGIIAEIVFLLCVTCLAKKSARASFCVMISLLFTSMSSLNMPSPIIITSGIIFLCNLRKIRLKGKHVLFSYMVITFFFYFLIRFLDGLFLKSENLYNDAIAVDFISVISLCLAILLITENSDVIFVERWIGLLGVLATIFGFFYFLNNETAYLGQLYSDTNFAGKGVIGDDIVKSWLRWVPIDKEPNFWAAYLLFPFGFWLHAVVKKTSFMSMLCLAITYLGILFSYSRSSFIVSSFVLFYVIFTNKKQYFIKILLAFVFVFVCVSLYSPEVVDRIFSINDNIKSEGGSGRFELWKEAVVNFLSNPLFGIGTGQTPMYSPSHLGTHNLYLQILGENGILGFSVFLFIWLTALFRMKRYISVNSFYFYGFLGFSINLMTVHGCDLRIPLFVIALFYVSEHTITSSNRNCGIVSI